MQSLSDQQIDFIINDIRARGVMMESLRDDLVDHVCCILENSSDESGDFRQRYERVIKTFYREDLSEIEAETKMLLNNKNYYAMKKVMIATGVVSAALLAIGIALKFLHLPGAAFAIVVGAALFSLLFLPLSVLLKLKEGKSSRDKALIITGSVAAAAMSVGILFKIMWWPYANMLGMISIGILCLIYLPINLFTGLRNAETKVNSVVSSVVLVVSCALFLSLVRSPYNSRMQDIRTTDSYLRSEQTLKTEQLLMEKQKLPLSPNSVQLLKDLESMRVFLLRKETGAENIPSDFTNSNIFIRESHLAVYIGEKGEGRELLDRIQRSFENYNGMNSMKLPGNVSLFDLKNGRVNEALNDIIMMELQVIQAERMRFSGVS